MTKNPLEDCLQQFRELYDKKKQINLVSILLSHFFLLSLRREFCGKVQIVNLLLYHTSKAATSVVYKLNGNMHYPGN